MEEEPEPASEAHPWIIAWGMLCGFRRETTLSQLRLAEAELAPRTALSRFHQERWVTLEDVDEHAYETRLWLLDYAWSRGLTIPYEVLKVWLDPNAVRPSTVLERNALS